AIISTSANISGEMFPKQFSEISKEIKNNVDYIVNLRQNELMSTPSSILIINEDNSITKIR
ncbi:MAG: Sua5/YciO/YrdC/YwlC family protein, partial [Flavobacteriales bacterium]